MKAKITYMWDNWETYEVSSEKECKDSTDKSAYDQLERMSGQNCVQLGLVCIERI